MFPVYLAPKMPCPSLCIKSEKFLHIFCCQTTANTEHLSNLEIVSLLFRRPEKSILEVSVLLTWEAQHVTSKKAQQLERRRLRLQAFKESRSPSLLSAPYMASGSETVAAPGEGCATGGVCEGSQPFRLPAQLATLHVHKTSHGPAVAPGRPAIVVRFCPSCPGESGLQSNR